MEEYESQTEPVEEHLHHHAEHASEKWVSGVALTAALLAALAAVSAMVSGHFVNDAMLDRIDAADHWAEYQAEAIKSSAALTRIDGHALHDRPADPEDRKRIDRYEHKKKELEAEAREEEKSSKSYLHRHTRLAAAVTLFQVAIAVSAISALTRRRPFWYVGMGLGCVGVVFLLMGLLPGHAGAT